MARRVHGNFRSLLKRLPDSVAEELRTLQDDTGKLLLSRALARVPVYSGPPRKGRVPGALKAGLGYKVTPKTLRLRFGIIGKAKNADLFYAGFQERGWRPYRKNRKRKLGPISSAPGTSAYRIAALSRRKQRVPGKHFVYNLSREQIYRPYQKLWGRAIQRAAQGARDA